MRFLAIGAVIVISAAPLGARAQTCPGVENLDPKTHSPAQMIACLEDMQARLTALEAAVGTVTPDAVKDAFEADPAAMAALKGADGKPAEPSEVLAAFLADEAAMRRLGDAARQGLDALPDAAVVAFDGSACPEDWEPYTPATARMIVGAGDKWHPKHRKWEKQLPTGGVEPTDLESIEAMSSGGEVAHILTVEEMPEHAHTMLWGRTDVDTEGRKGKGNDVKRGLLPIRPIHSTLSEGAYKPHNNMPPYIALYFCQKK